MGRYYNGDIEGKFWFAVQDSNDADNFGVTGTTSDELNYYFDKENLKDIKKGIKKCLEELGKYKKLLDEFFKENEMYNNEELSKYLKVSAEKLKPLLTVYARWELGEKILNCVNKNGSCQFTAEG